MAITRGEIANSILEIKMDPIPSKEEEDVVAKAMDAVDLADVVALVAVDPHQETYITNN